MAAEVWDRFTVHYTPTHGSWLNQAEIEIGIFSRQCLGKRRIPNLESLRREAKAWRWRMNRGSRQDRLEVRSQNCQAQVRLQKEILYAVRDLGACICRKS